MSTKLQTHKYKCKCKLVTYTQALESVADLKQIALLVITFPCRCRGVGRPRRERVDAHFRHRFIRCPCRCRGLGRPRREKVDAQSHTNKQVNSLFCDRGSDQRAASSICLTKEIRLAAAHSPWPSNANIRCPCRCRGLGRPRRDEMLHLPGDSRPAAFHA